MIKIFKFDLHRDKVPRHQLIRIKEEETFCPGEQLANYLYKILLEGLDDFCLVYITCIHKH